ncbi:hypothetical protein [Nonomuraea aurantiaca]|uniref:hypothetical protein n=1 Tax=Nonomuraea aurantiaca TaxID=2878562 RepID=UPI001CD924F8|nr:hypothetical protein [Nonomuraea aurantiaca]MCA2229701.1 hypothetical protein [Nonomuraea aurantiaca]
MRARALGGLGLLVSAMLCLAGTLTASAEVMWGAGAWAGAMWGAGAWAGVAATATVYRDVARHAGRGRAAVALALLGVVASAWMVEATLWAAGGRWVAAQSVPRLALACAAAVGIALLAYGLTRAGLVRPAAGAAIAFAALLGPLTGDPGAPYLLGAGPLGVALLAGAIRTRIPARRSQDGPA